MPLFQKSVVNKHLKTFDETLVSQAYATFNHYFKDLLRLTNIVQLKEENYQEGFLRELFVDVLGYTINPNENYNLTTEFKNQTDSKKADGAIIKNNQAIGVIELKSAKFLDLKYIEKQAFNYKNNQPNCRYVITSTFRMLRLYIDNSTQYEEFNLFNLDYENFKLLYLFLSKESIFKNTPILLKEETQQNEEDITLKFYKDYKQFKDKIFDNLLKNNAQYDKILLLKKTQKLLDRVLFIAFAEDKGLIPPNALSRTIDKWKIFVNEGDKISLYSRYQLFFNHLNNGFTIPDWGEIPAYNGGLFAFDDILDSKELIIDNKILQEGVLRIAKYDFNTEIDVNILGHIFEHSLNEFDEIAQDITSPDFKSLEKLPTKRKKDGVFYTPDYITKYIVENTIGDYCAKKKTDINLEIFENHESFKNKQGKLNKTGKEYFEKLQIYKNWLYDLKILDPACGSGAFLIAALDFLIAEHKQVDELMYHVTGEAIKFFDTDKTILEKNIYGVDINQESVEIAKLSLWLHTAKKERKLSDLSGNIKCGNSLIDNKEVAGEKAFVWEEEFSEIMKNGGFDVVIGNPPYVEARSIEQKKVDFYRKNYKTAGNRVNTFSIFIEKAIILIKNESFMGMIIHRNLIRSNDYEKTRAYILENTRINSLLSFGIGVFKEVTGEMAIITLQKTKSDKTTNEIKIFKYDKLIDKSEVEYINQNIFVNSLGKRFNIYLTKEIISVLAKIQMNSVELGDNAIVLQGIIVGDEKKLINKQKLNEKYKPILRGRDIARYNYPVSKEFVFYEQGTKVLTRGKTPDLFEKSEKILTQHVSDKIIATLETEQLYFLQTINSVISNTKEIENKYLLALLNSKVINFYYSFTFNLGAEFTTAVAIENLEKLPIKTIPVAEQNEICDLVNKILVNSKEKQKIANKFTDILCAEFNFDKITKKLMNWHLEKFSIFLTELAKMHVILKGQLKEDWFERYERFNKRINELDFENNLIISKIDHFIYQLYNLTPQEIQIIENAK